MTGEQFDVHWKALPFRPFIMRMSDGRSFTVRHQDFLYRPPKRRIIYVYEEEDNGHVLDLRLMTEIEVLDSDELEAA